MSTSHLLLLSLLACVSESSVQVMEANKLPWAAAVGLCPTGTAVLNGTAPVTLLQDCASSAFLKKTGHRAWLGETAGTPTRAWTIKKDQSTPVHIQKTTTKSIKAICCYPVPTASPTTEAPTPSPTAGAPTTQPPSFSPTMSTGTPSSRPSTSPTPAPTAAPTLSPAPAPTRSPTLLPTASPTTPTSSPSPAPTAVPTPSPTGLPTGTPTQAPTGAPTPTPTAAPTTPTAPPSQNPTASPTTASSSPTGAPSHTPTTPAPTSLGSCSGTLSGSTEATGSVALDIVIPVALTSLTFRGCNSNFDTHLTLYDTDGTTVLADKYDIASAAEASSCTGHPNAVNMEVKSVELPVCGGLQPGTYTLVVSGVNGASGNYDIDVLCTQYTTVTRTAAPRIRRSFMELTTAEQEEYCDAFKILHTSGDWQMLSRVHFDHSIHQHSAFLPWHREYIAIMEDVIRGLGVVNGHDFSDFAMPYFNSAAEKTPYEGEWDIYSTCIGGGLGSDTCLSNAWIDGYTPNRFNCLKREKYSDTRGACTGIAQESTIMTVVANGLYAEFSTRLEGIPHSQPHICAGGQMETYYAPDDPLFYMHHAFIDYQWALWQDCNDWDISDMSHKAHYDHNDICLSYGDFSLGVSVSDTFDLAAEYHVVYDGGEFFEDASVMTHATCTGNINSSWFAAPTSVRRRLSHGNERNEVVKQHKEHAKDVLQSIRRGVDSNPAYATLDKASKGKIVADSWAVQMCYERENATGNACELPPRDYDDCSQMPRDAVTGDITVSKAQLLGKYGNTDCMAKTIDEFYGWAWARGELKYLCAGCYDPFCERQLVVAGKCREKDHPNLRFEGATRTSGALAGVVAGKPPAPAVRGNENENHSDVWKRLFGDEVIVANGSALYDVLAMASLVVAGAVMVVSFCVCVYSSRQTGKYAKVADSGDELWPLAV